MRRVAENTRLCCNKCQRDCKGAPEFCEGNILCLAKCNPSCTYRKDGKCTAEWPFMDKDSDSDSELITCYFLDHWEDGTLVFTDAEHLVGYIDAEVGGMDEDYDPEDVSDAEADLKAIFMLEVAEAAKEFRFAIKMAEHHYEEAESREAEYIRGREIASGKNKN